jgi:hypothetical protein
MSRADQDGDLQSAGPPSPPLREVTMITRMPGSPEWTGVVLQEDGDRSLVFWSDSAASSVRTQFLITKGTP